MQFEARSTRKKWSIDFMESLHLPQLPAGEIAARWKRGGGCAHDPSASRETRLPRGWFVFHVYRLVWGESGLTSILTRYFRAGSRKENQAKLIKIPFFLKIEDWQAKVGEEFGLFEGAGNKNTFSYFSLEIFHFEHEKVQIFCFWFCNT